MKATNYSQIRLLIFTFPVACRLLFLYSNYSRSVHTSSHPPSDLIKMSTSTKTHLRALRRTSLSWPPAPSSICLESSGVDVFSLELGKYFLDLRVYNNASGPSGRKGEVDWAMAGVRQVLDGSTEGESRGSASCGQSGHYVHSHVISGCKKLISGRSLIGFCRKDETQVHNHHLLPHPSPIAHSTALPIEKLRQP